METSSVVEAERLKSFHIRAFPVELRHRLNELAAKRRITIRELVIEALKDLVDQDKNASD